MSDTVLSIRDLRVYFNIRAGTVRAVDGVDLDIAEGENSGSSANRVPERPQLRSPSCG